MAESKPAWLFHFASPRNRTRLWGIVAGIAYGVILQTAGRGDNPFVQIATFGYIFILPFVLGFSTVRAARSTRWKHILLDPWVAACLALVFAALVGWEGTICLVLAAPAYLVMASIGGLAAGLLNRRGQPPTLAFAGLLLLPVGTAVVEGRRTLPQHVVQVSDSIDIDATPDVVWQHIIRVAPIEERLDGFIYTAGFPRPIEATLSHEEVGGVRHASFERGLVFQETVDVWEPPRALGFGISADRVPAAALDPHVAVGGPYFDILHGRYDIEALAPRKVRLHLRSEHRISTFYNWYAEPWSRYTMGSIQRSILRVLKNRCESRAT